MQMSDLSVLDERGFSLNLSSPAVYLYQYLFVCLLGYGFATFIMHDVTSQKTYKNVRSSKKLKSRDIFYNHSFRLESSFFF